MSDVREIRMLSCRMHAMTTAEWLEAVAGAVAEGERRILVGQNLHSVYLVQRDPALRELQERASHVRIDGLPLIVFGRLLGHPLGRRHRSGFMDLIDPLLARAAREGWRVLHLGGRPGVGEAAADRLRERHPGLSLASRHGYFDPSDPVENGAVLTDIEAFGPDLLLVGMGMPRQERWILANRDRVGAPAVVACGAAMDYVAGEVAMAPRWLSALGLEWAFRLVLEPRRLGYRYLVEPWFVLALFARDLAARVRNGAAPRRSPK